MVDNIVSDGFGLGVELHDGLLEDVLLVEHVLLLGVHPRALSLSLRQRILKHDLLLIQSLLLSHVFCHTFLQELTLLFVLVQLVMEIFWDFLLLSGLISDTTDLRFNLENLVVFLLDELLDGLESFVSLLHTEETLLPIFKQCLLAHNDSFDFNCCFFECVPGCCCFLLLRDQLCLVERFLFVKPLDFLVHLINE